MKNKYNIGDEVWFVDKEEGVSNLIITTISLQHPSGSSHNLCITYRGIARNRQFEENELFATRQECLEHHVQKISPVPEIQDEELLDFLSQFKTAVPRNLADEYCKGFHFGLFAIREFIKEKNRQPDSPSPK